ncbi:MULTISPECIES: hypothetical protein [Acetobacter]|uniref:Uncharacterized protein n=1 Tax=Acetobacter tropicalis TaxID=104102 RepID=A0A291PDF2_9PROT|nr:MULTISPECIES: hypothetical protein [Acetobacter]ATJ89404.1 hypothetical protein CIW82_00400 [Acetobacter tropicalis]
MSRKFNVKVESDVLVVLREEAFTPAFMEQFRENFFSFDELHEHAEHIGRLLASGMMEDVGRGFGDDQFVEGYGRIGDFVRQATLEGTDATSTKESAA